VTVSNQSRPSIPELSNHNNSHLYIAMLLAAPLTFVLALLSSSAIATSVSLERRSPITIYHGTCKEHVDDIKKGLKLADGPFPGDFTYKGAFIFLLYRFVQIVD
jgi:hypothetical protein